MLYDACCVCARALLQQPSCRPADEMYGAQFSNTPILNLQVIEKFNQMEDKYNVLLKNYKMLYLKEQQATALSMELNAKNNNQHFNITHLEKKLREMPKLLDSYVKMKREIATL